MLGYRINQVLKIFIIIGLLVTTLTACRYWSLYRFGQQFCDYEQNVSVSERSARVEVIFHDPVLPLPVFERYLGSHAFSSRQTPYHLEQNYLIAPENRLTDTFSIVAVYNAMSDVPTLQSGSLDLRLSEVFPVSFVDKFLGSVCSDDIDLSREKLVVDMALPEFSPADLPELRDLRRTFGEPVAIEALSTGDIEYSYTFRFLSFEDAMLKPQSKALHFTMRFDRGVLLKALVLDYYRYHLTIDFEAQHARLTAIRSAES